MTHRPTKGDKLFFMHREVEVTKAYPTFDLARVRYAGEGKEFFVDISSLRDTPDYSPSISVSLMTKKEE